MIELRFYNNRPAIAIYTAVALVSSPAVAQQQQVQQTPPEVALQLNNVIGSWAQTIVNQTRQIETLQTKNAELQKQLDELKPKKKGTTP